MDFTKVQLLDKVWWQKTNALIRRMADDDESTMLRYAFDYQCALVGNPGVTDDSFKTATRMAKELYADMVKVQSPWSDPSKQRQQQHAGLIDAYKQYIGDPNDPEFRRKLEQDLAKLEERNAEVPVESEDERINRLLAERDAYNAAKLRR